MARYIDADKLIAHLKDEIKACEPKFGGRVNGKSVAYGTELGLKSAISFAETLSTEDVVQNSEVEEMMIGKANSLCAKFLIEEQEGRGKALMAEHDREVAREIFEEIENDYADFLFDGYRNIIVLTERDYNELKKKYTEGE